MKKELKPKKLVLSKQTLRALDAEDLTKVKAAREDVTNDGLCGQMSIGGCRTLSGMACE